MLATINFNKINNKEHIKGKSLWEQVNFDNLEEEENIDHFSFSFKTASLNDLLLFSIHLINGDNTPITFTVGENKISILNFKTEVFLE